MTASHGLVSVVVPTLNASKFIDPCLDSVRAQIYPDIELIVVDGYSRDDTVKRVQAFTDKVYLYGNGPAKPGIFTAPGQRNYGASMASGDFIYYVDADMTLPPALVAECLSQLVALDADAVIVRERSFGTGFWASVKAYERSFYFGDDLVEAPRFVKTSVWKALGGLDISVGGNDDWDFHRRMQSAGYRVARSTLEVSHNEGELSLARLARKRFMYGRYTRRFIKKHGFKQAVAHYNPFRRYLARADNLARHPIQTAGLLAMRSVEYVAGGIGMVVGPPE